MKKIITSLLVGATAFAAIPVSGLVRASAGEKQTVLMEEQFAQDALDQTKWDVTGDSVSLFADKETGHIHNPNNLEAAHIGIKNEIKNLEYMQFDVKFLAKKWMAIYFSPEEKMNLGDYDPEMFMNMAGDGKFSSGGGKFSFTNYKIPATMGEWFTMKFVKKSATTMDLYVCERGQDINKATLTTTITLNAVSEGYTFNKFYFAIAGEGGQAFSMDNIIVKSESVDFEERVYSETLNENIRFYGANSEIVRPDSSLTMAASQAGDGIQYRAVLNPETSIISDLEVMKMKFSVSFANAQAGDALAYGFGIMEGEAYNDGAYACVMEKDGVSIVYYDDNQQTELLKKVSANLTSATEVEIVANKNGTISVALNGEVKGSYQVDEEDYYAGAFGFYATNNNAGTISVDTVRLVSKTYKVPVTKSVSHNFSNDFFGNEGYEDFVCHSSTNRLYVEGGKLVFDNAVDDCYFGSAYEYDNFIIDYKICSIKAGANFTGPDRWIGLDIGRSIPGKTQYGTHFMLAYQITPTAASVNLWSYTHDTSELEQTDINKRIVQHKRIPQAYFEAIQYDDVSKMESDVQEKDAICVRYVAENGTIRMFLKRACEPEYQLYATVNDVETTGYVAITCTGYTTMKIDDFTCANISGVYVNADTYAPETIIKENQVVIFDKNVSDPLAFEEVAANSQGCTSTIAATCCVLPMLAAGVALMKKNRKDEDQ